MQNALPAEVKLLSDRVQELYAAIEKTLRQNIFDNTGQMGSLRFAPATSRQIVDTFLQTLAGDAPQDQLADQLADLTRRGLGPRAAIAVADVLCWHSLELLERPRRGLAETPAALSTPPPLPPQRGEESGRAIPPLGGSGGRLRPDIEAYRQQFLYHYMQAQAEHIIATRESVYQNIGAALEKQINLEQQLRLDLERQQQQLARRVVELETVAQVSAAVATILEVDRLLQEVADLTRDRFKLYHAHIYLLNEPEGALDLAAGAGEVGRQMKTLGWRISLEREHSLVARAARSRQGVMVNDVHKTPDFLPNPLLPKTRSELAVPLIARDKVLGVLDVQSDQLDYFTNEDVRIHTLLANQVAIALRNANQHQQTQLALAEVQQSQELLRAIVDSTPDWIFIKDQEHRYRMVNQGYANALHLKPEDFIGRNDLELGFPEELVKGNPAKGIRGFWTDDRQVMDSGKLLLNPHDPATIDGEVHVFHTIKTPLRNREGQVEGVLAFARDVTERERLLAEVEAAYRQYVQRVWTQFLGEHHGGWHIELQVEKDPPPPRGGKGEADGEMLSAFQAEVAREGKVKTISGAGDNGQAIEPTVAAPITLRGEVIGTLSLQDIDPERIWTADEIALVETVSEQLALTIENLRLFDETQKRASREQLTRQITDKMRASPDIETIIQTGVTELARALGVSRAYVKLSSKPGE